MEASRVPSLQAPLKRQIRLVREALIRSFGMEADGALLIGSCARGEATHRSDIDLLIFLKQGPSTFEKTRIWRDRLDSALEDLGALDAPLPVQAFFLLPEAWETSDPSMIGNFKDSVILFDPERILETRLRNRFHEQEPRRYDE